MCCLGRDGRFGGPALAFLICHKGHLIARTSKGMYIPQAGRGVWFAAHDGLPIYSVLRMVTPRHDVWLSTFGTFASIELQEPGPLPLRLFSGNAAEDSARRGEATAVKRQQTPCSMGPKCRRG